MGCCAACDRGLPCTGSDGLDLPLEADASWMDPLTGLDGATSEALESALYAESEVFQRGGDESEAIPAGMNAVGLSPQDRATYEAWRDGRWRGHRLFSALLAIYTNNDYAALLGSGELELFEVIASYVNEMAPSTEAGLQEALRAVVEAGAAQNALPLPIYLAPPASIPNVYPTVDRRDPAAPRTTTPTAPTPAKPHIGKIALSALRRMIGQGKTPAAPPKATPPKATEPAAPPKATEPPKATPKKLPPVLFDTARWPKTGGPRVLLASVADGRARSSQAQGYFVISKNNPLPAPLQPDLYEWAALERAYQEGRSNYGVASELPPSVAGKVEGANGKPLQMGGNPLAHAALVRAYVVGRIRFDRFALAVTQVDPWSIAKGRTSKHKGATCDGTIAGEAYLEPSCIFHEEREAELYRAWRQDLAGKSPYGDQATRDLHRAVVHSARSPQFQVIPPPPSEAVLREIALGEPLKPTGFDVAGMVGTVKGWFTREQVDGHTLDNALYPASDDALGLLPVGAGCNMKPTYGDALDLLPTSCGCLGPTRANAPLSEADQKQVARLRQIRAQAKDLALRCMGGNLSACAELPKLARLLASDPEVNLYGAQDPAAVALAVIGDEDQTQSQSLYEMAEGWFTGLHDRLVAAWEVPAREVEAHLGALRGWLASWAAWLNPATWWNKARAALTPTSADGEGWTTGQMALAAFAAVAASAIAGAAYVAPHALELPKEFVGRYFAFQTDLINAISSKLEEILSFFFPARAAVAAVAR
jgi:hypothetical protein